MLSLTDSLPAIYLTSYFKLYYVNNAVYSVKQYFAADIYVFAEDKLGLDDLVVDKTCWLDQHIRQQHRVW